MKQIDDLLSAIFFRLSCPEPETLGDYYLGRLMPGQRLVVARHLRECPHCTRELALYAAPERGQESTLYASESVLGGLLSTVKGGLQGLVGRVLWADPVPAALPVPALRGAAGGLLVYQAADVRVVLEVGPATGGYRRKRLLGQVEPRGAAIGAELWDGAELLDNIAVSRDSYFAFDRLKRGRYILCLRGNEREIWLEVDVEDGS
jgi:hypothetical protein